MVRLAAEIKRGFLSALYLQAQASATPMILALREFLLSGFGGLQTGRLVVSHTGAGKTTVFQIPRIDQQFKQEEVFGFAQELLEVYADAATVAGITAAQQQDGSQDATLYSTMLADDRLTEVTRTVPDFTNLLAPWR